MLQTITEQDAALTRGGKMLIETAIMQTKSTNRREIMNYICDALTTKYSGTALDYQVERMNFRTTGDILKAIDTYMYREIKNGVVRIKPTNELIAKVEAFALPV